MKHVLEHSDNQSAAVPESNNSMPVVTGANPLDLPANVFQAGLDRREPYCAHVLGAIGAD